MKGISSLPVRRASLSAIARVISLPSMTHGPPMKRKGFSLSSRCRRLLLFPFQLFLPVRFRDALIKSLKRGWGLKGFDLNSGWNWQARNHG